MSRNVTGSCHIPDSVPSFPWHMAEIQNTDGAKKAVGDQPHLLPCSPFLLPASLAAAFQIHGHLYFTPFAPVLPGTCFTPTLVGLNSIYSSGLSSKSLVREVFPAHTQSQPHLLISFMVSCPFPYQTLSLIICVIVCHYIASSLLTTVFPSPPRAGTQKGCQSICNIKE